MHKGWLNHAYPNNITSTTQECGNTEQLRTRDNHCAQNTVDQVHTATIANVHCCVEECPSIAPFFARLLG